MSQRAKPEPRAASEARVPEPSIEEILASIRRSIVPEDVVAEAVPAARPAPRRSRRRSEAATAGRETDTREGNGRDAGARETDSRESGGGAGTGMVRRGNGDGGGTVTWQADGPLLSPRTAAAVDTAFGALKDTVVTHNPPTLEDLAREMLRPMLKAWLDANLPGMVERLVQAEIERVSRRG